MSVVTLPTARLLNRKEAAAYCGMSASTFQTKVNAGLMPAGIALGDKMKRWDVRDLDRAIDLLAGKVEAERSDDEWLDALDENQNPGH